MHGMVIVTGVYLLYYICWRTFYTLNYSALLFAVLLLACEIQGVINFYLFAFMTWNVDGQEAGHFAKECSVDVFIPTYNEELEILEATIVGCVSMRTGHKTYILDDGRREEVRELAQMHGCHYLTRPDNKHAKAGNINQALKITDGDFIVILDADMIPQPDFLEKTLGYFNDEKVSIVQLPQEFYNIDSVQYAKDKMHWHEQQLFYHVIQPGKNNRNSAFWCGSPSIIRRKAIEDVGGVATESITEDFLTSIKLNARKWKIRYHKEVLAFGIAPQSLFAFNLQRLRWAQGSMKILRSRYNPLIMPGLSISQRLSHFSAIFTYFDAYQKLLFYLMPSIFLFTNILPIREDIGIEFLYRWVPYYLLSMGSNILLGRGYFKYFEVEKFNTLKMATFLKASFTLVLFKKLVFRVTPKSTDNSIKKMERKELRIQMIILVMILISIVVGFLNVFFNIFFEYASFVMVAVALFWSVFNVIILISSLKDVLGRMYYRKDYRFPAHLGGYMQDKNGNHMEIKIENVSRSGMGFTQTGVDINGKEIVWDQIEQAKLYLPEGDIDLNGDIVFQSMTKDGLKKAGLHFRDIPFEERRKLYKYLFVTVPRELYIEKNELFSGLMSLIDRCTKRRR